MSVDTERDERIEEIDEVMVSRKEPLIIRAATVEAVRHPEREIDLMVFPYGVRSEVQDVYGTYTEEVPAGAFKGAERRAQRIKIFRDHDETKPVGRAKSVITDDDKALYSVLRISRTPLGDETLELAEDGVLEPSVGARPLPAGDQWSMRRDYVLRTKLFLEHIALVPFGHYRDHGARVLAVRADANPLVEVANPVSATPLLDAYRLELLMKQYEAIDLRYSSRPK